MEQGQSEESLIESSERTDELRMRNTPAGTNALLRRIDLCCKILAPIVVGQVMTYVSKIAGVWFLAGWNVVSVFGEYYLLWKVFKAVTALSHKVIDTTRHNSNIEENSSVDMPADESHGSNERLEWMENEDQERGQNDAEDLVPAVTVRPVQRPRKPSVYARFKKRILTFKTGWHIYFRQSVARPGLALASLYFTVISFGAITTGYAYTQCLSESVLSLIRGIGSLFGVLATFIFPRLRNAVGVVRCGLFSMSLQFSCLLLCVAAVFAPGSPFFLLPRNSVQPLLPQCEATQPTTPTPTLSPSCMNEGPRNVSLSVHPSNLQFVRRDVPSSNITSATDWMNGSKTPAIPSTKAIGPSKTTPSVVPSNSIVSPSPSSSPSNRNCSLKTTASPPPAISSSFSYVSISLLLAGIVSSRLGLWLSDLTIVQLTQEAVPEQERGIVGGMQNSFNSILSLLMYGLVIALPKPETFGLLALMSVGAVGIGGLLYASFAYKIRGHLFHFEKVGKFCGGAEARREPVPMLISNDDLDLEDDEEEAMIRGVLSTRNENFKY
ncbi:Solute carrier family 40 member 1 [Stylophora pistillata]|uniref:Solute carrier family 40 member n=1 Tax=Stylophora pistillata TaxID=50429 RepID=A0A2B4SGH3_STYPI|nr:Solute carrier family 40 member 1 [Stylophora pistillata]